ncbi:MAG: hypothetical protein KJO60_06145 [Desulfofustis sp.]|nr:hypothetical protein [Desulfofustis sp.]MBT8354081.1 hypothetical protein [Desulfofustis sp.]NNK58607.1 hypothetical protein [Desulfofustis sp.]
MWLFTRDGFFSAVHDDYCGPEELMIRARVIEDLQRLLDKLKIDDADILVIKNADYRYRVKLSHAQWCAYVAAEAARIDYANFNNSVAADEPDRSSAYMKCWEAMYLFQEAKAQFNHWVDD